MAEIKLSVIIVNYNVKYFLDQALQAALKAAEKVSTEIIVVDNSSVDGSDELLRRKFPEVTAILNKDNVGFSVANNQGIEVAKGEYVLLLNPDTVVEEDTFEKTVAFMDQHPEAGGLGVKMVDGKGKFLPESKRAFPSPAVAFYKAFGLSSLFPRSRTFGRYHLGFLDEDEVNEVEVLAGAFMLLRKRVLDEIGLLDETFFMYGEDIDLSYRIVEAGYKNYYFPHTRIIHYKGESTKKGSLNYVRMFYSAMKIFARKHFTGSNAWLFIGLINLAIYFRASLALLSRAVRKFTLPAVDAAAIFLGMFLLKGFWENNIKVLEGVKYPQEYLLINVPLYILIWLTAVFLSGGYDRTARISRLVRGLLVGTVFIAALYGFLEEGLRFSRGMILSGAIWAMFAMTTIRLVYNFLVHGNFRFGETEEKRTLIVGGEAESRRVRSLLSDYEVDASFVGYVQADDPDFSDSKLLGNLSDLGEIQRTFSIDEIIFCAKDVSSGAIISWMTRLGPEPDYKIVPSEGLSIIGSNSKNRAGDLYSIDIHLRLSSPENRRSKRLLDLTVALVLIPLSPLLAPLVHRTGGYFNNIFEVLLGRKSWVGYAAEDEKGKQVSSNLKKAERAYMATPETALPVIRPGVLSPLNSLRSNDLAPKLRRRLNLLYARDYRTGKDIQIILKGWRYLGSA